MATKQEIRRSEQSTSAMLLEVIGPALIMLMIGSLVFFLIEVFYRGPHTLRLCWVYGLFTFASVLVSRVSITIGRERALMLGSALGMAAFTTSFVLVEFEGAMGIVLEPFLLISLILVVMWTASKLTWDCTVIDKSRDSSAVGITELVRRRFRGNPAESESSQNKDDQETTDDSSQQTSDAQAGNLIKAFFQSKKQRKNTPGIWVFYLSMAALPIFGIGQWFVVPSYQGGYWWVVLLFAIYLASGLALMMTTSLLGLQRYLRKRKTHMPPEITRTWLGAGAVISLMVIILVMLFPRPNASSSIANGLKWFTSPPQKSSDMALGKDGTEQKSSGNSSKSSEKGKQSSSNAKTKSTSGESKNAEKTKSGGKGKGENSSSSSSKSQKSKSGEQSKQKQNQSNSGDQDNQSKQSNENSSKSDSKQDNQSNQGDQNEQKSDSGDKNNSGDQGKSDSQNKNDSANDDQGNEPKTNVPDHMRPDKSAEEAKRQKEEEAQRKKEQQEESENNSESGSSDDSEESSSSGNPNPSASPPSPPSPSFEALSQIASLITYLVAGIAAIVIFIMFRKEIIAALKSMIAELKNLFGAKQQQQDSTPLAPGTRSPAKRNRPFSGYQNPFQTGNYSNTPPEKIVEYTFLALEAWADEQGIARPDDWTPHEFAASLKTVSPKIGSSANHLANLFCKNLFGQRNIKPQEIEPLKELWVLMQNTNHTQATDVAFAG